MTAESRFVNRELSWLEFNQRVLDEAMNPSVPLMERLKFLAITSSNLDEFFMVRVGGLQMLARKGRVKTDIAGLTPTQQLDAVSTRVHEMALAQDDCYLNELKPRLMEAGIRCLSRDELTPAQADVISRFFDSEIYPLLTPMAVSECSEFPLLVNQSLNLLVSLEPEPDGDHGSRYAIIPLGQSPSRFISLPCDTGYAYMLLEDVVANFLDRFFPGQQVRECVPFRISRNADLTLREDLASDLLAEMEHVLDERKQSATVRLELDASASNALRSFMQTCLGVDDLHIYASAAPLDLAAFMQLAELSGYESLKYEPWAAQQGSGIDPSRSMFDLLASGDVLLYHPFESFEPVVRLIEEAAEDPDVIAIKQVLYRISRHSPIVAALKRAAENGKYVTAVVELKARFDEARNIEWAREMERSAVQVIYGAKGFKIHAKVCVIARREANGIRRYVHYGTGNYNEATARLYTDVSYMSSNDELGADASIFFNAVNGYSQLQKFNRLAMAPITLRDQVLELIRAEAERCQQGQKAHIMVKLNALADKQVIDALYEASQAGVKIQLNVRGICCLRPGVSGLSENITVVSIVDRFLEHSRIFYFHHGGDERVLISSADWMPRNLDHRMELMVPIDDPPSKARLVRVLEACLQDTVKGRIMRSDGTYEHLAPKGKQTMGSQEVLYREACDVVKRDQQSRRLVFEPHRAPRLDT
jgi:polyphosphate kinase